MKPLALYVVSEIARTVIGSLALLIFAAVGCAAGAAIVYTLRALWSAFA